MRRTVGAHVHLVQPAAGRPRLACLGPPLAVGVAALPWRTVVGLAVVDARLPPSDAGPGRSWGIVRGAWSSRVG
jgi:hypothetical protein